MSDDDLLPRPHIRAALVEALGQGSVLLYGPRRVGKSTLLDQLTASPPLGLAVLRIDLEGLLQEPVEQLAEQLRHKLRAAGLLKRREIADRVESVQVAGQGVSLRESAPTGPWERLRDDLLEAAGAADAVLVLALDEVPWWLDAIVEREGVSAGRAALAALRRLRQDRAVAGRLRLVLTGSIGLAGFAAELGASAELNDLATVIVPPMSLEEGATLFEAELTARGLPCSAAAARQAAALAGGSPHWIKRLAATCGAGGAREAAAVEAAADALLAPALRKQFSDEGREHFRRRHPRILPALLAMLESVSASDSGNPRQAALNAATAAQPELKPGEVRECLHLLMDGFYLQEGPGDTLEWVNPLFRRWWSRYGAP